jgi:hypothetical protein
MYLDVDRVVRRAEPIDWDQVTARATAWRICSATYVVLSLTRELLGSPIPVETLGLLRPSRLRLALLEQVVRASEIASGEVRIGSKGERILHLILIDRFRDLSRALLWAFWPDTEWLALRYQLSNRGEVWRYRLSHVGRMFGLGAQALGEVSSSTGRKKRG